MFQTSAFSFYDTKNSKSFFISPPTRNKKIVFFLYILCMIFPLVSLFKKKLHQYFSTNISYLFLRSTRTLHSRDSRD